MPGFLRQSTASQSRSLGPFISDSDFKTPSTALTIANTDIKLVVNGAASANKNSGGGTHRSNGVYGVTFDATDTATVGEMEVNVLVSGALLVFDKFTVVEEAVYDAFYAAAAPGYVTTQIVASVSGAVGSVTGAVGSVTGLTAANLDTTISSRLASASYTAPPSANTNADALLDRADAIEVGLTPRQSLRLNSAALAGKLSGAATTTVAIRNAVADSKARITATVDADGNRSAVTTDVT